MLICGQVPGTPQSSNSIVDNSKLKTHALIFIDSLNKEDLQLTL